jgi:NADH dehydrogenase [ubiquinone] 1 alpha subcomplex assembly factor 7
MTLAEYMTECLLHPDLGYYTRKDPLGRAGDFITAPEISQMFGELIGLWLAQVWMDQGAPGDAILLEMGPGRGTLMADALRATRGVPGFHAAMDLHLVEASPHLREVQRTGARPAHPDLPRHAGHRPERPVFAIANEFFDALPIRQFQRARAGSGTNASSGWRPERSPSASRPRRRLPPLEPRLADTKPGMIVETCAPAEAIAAELGRRIARRAARRSSSTTARRRASATRSRPWRAIGRSDPSTDPGKADLTAHVAFGPAGPRRPPRKGQRAGAAGRFPRTPRHHRPRADPGKKLRGPALDRHIAAHRRLTHPDEMGHLFKVRALFPDGMATPPGFDA